MRALTSFALLLASTSTMCSAQELFFGALYQEEHLDTRSLFQPAAAQPLDLTALDVPKDPIKSKAKVLIFTHSQFERNKSCLPCERAKKWMKAQGVDYQVVIDDNFKQYPVIEIDNTRILGFREHEIKAILDPKPKLPPQSMRWQPSYFQCRS